LNEKNNIAVVLEFWQTGTAQDGMGKKTRVGSTPTHGNFPTIFEFLNTRLKTQKFQFIVG
jgi:hypothetical protein